MGYYGRLKLKQRARGLRKEGKSYSEIVKALHIPKTTVSDWCGEIQLTEKQIQKLYMSKMRGALRGSIIAAQQKIKLRKQLTSRLFSKGINDVGMLTKRDRFIAGVAFYASEGTKGDKGCAFANSNPAIIRFMVRWFREFGKVPEDKFRGAIWLHEELSEAKAKQFWSKMTGVPVNHFYKTYISQNKNDSKKIRKNVHEFGVFTLYVSDVMLIRTIMGWIGGVTRDP